MAVLLSLTSNRTQSANNSDFRNYSSQSIRNIKDITKAGFSERANSFLNAQNSLVSQLNQSQTTNETANSTPVKEDTDSKNEEASIDTTEIMGELKSLISEEENFISTNVENASEENNTDKNEKNEIQSTDTAETTVQTVNEDDENDVSKNAVVSQGVLNAATIAPQNTSSDKKSDSKNENYGSNEVSSVDSNEEKTSNIFLNSDTLNGKYEFGNNKNKNSEDVIKKAIEENSIIANNNEVDNETDETLKETDELRKSIFEM